MVGFNPRRARAGAATLRTSPTMRASVFQSTPRPRGRGDEPPQPM
jgi:hypothetical protein